MLFQKSSCFEQWAECCTAGCYLSDLHFHHIQIATSTKLGSKPSHHSLYRGLLIESPTFAAYRLLPVQTWDQAEPSFLLRENSPIALRGALLERNECTLRSKNEEPFVWLSCVHADAQMFLENLKLVCVGHLWRGYDVCPPTFSYAVLELDGCDMEFKKRKRRHLRAHCFERGGVAQNFR
jgi:hypothetical protein